VSQVRLIAAPAHSELANQELEDLPVTVALNSEWPEGLSSSIRCGINAINQDQQPLLGALLMLADQPLITSTQLARLTNTFRNSPARIVASQYQIGKEIVQGVPAVFGSELFSEMLSLRGRNGAKPLIRKYELTCDFISMPEAVVDIDTPADFERAKTTIRASQFARHRQENSIVVTLRKNGSEDSLTGLFRDSDVTPSFQQ